MAEGQWSTMPEAANALARGEFVVVVDDESREDEGDLVLAAQFATATACAFMVEHTNGILCAPLSEARAAELDLPPMVANNKDRNQTAFTVTIDAAEGTSTGASASDRAHTIRVLSEPSSKAADFNRPGHMFPLVARPGGTLERGGHTEASVDLCLLAGCRPVALICELMHRNGTMMRRPACHAIAKEHNLAIITTAQIVAFRTGVQDSANPPVAIATPADDKAFVQAAEAAYHQKYLSGAPNKV